MLLNFSVGLQTASLKFHIHQNYESLALLISVFTSISAEDTLLSPETHACAVICSQAVERLLVPQLWTNSEAERHEI
jgi:hypothetical protein